MRRCLCSSMKVVNFVSTENRRVGEAGKVPWGAVSVPLWRLLILFLQRIDVLVKQEKYHEALSLALSFYEGRAKAVLGLTGSTRQKKDQVADLVCVQQSLLLVKSLLQRKFLCPWPERSVRASTWLHLDSLSVCLYILLSYLHKIYLNLRWWYSNPTKWILFFT